MELNYTKIKNYLKIGSFFVLATAAFGCGDKDKKDKEKEPEDLLKDEDIEEVYEDFSLEIQKVEGENTPENEEIDDVKAASDSGTPIDMTAPDDKLTIDFAVKATKKFKAKKDGSVKVKDPKKGEDKYKKVKAGDEVKDPEKDIDLTSQMTDQKLKLQVGTNEAVFGARTANTLDATDNKVVITAVTHDETPRTKKVTIDLMQDSKKVNSIDVHVQINTTTSE